MGDPFRSRLQMEGNVRNTFRQLPLASTGWLGWPALLPPPFRMAKQQKAGAHCPCYQNESGAQYLASEESLYFQFSNSSQPLDASVTTTRWGPHNLATVRGFGMKLNLVLAFALGVLANVASAQSSFGSPGGHEVSPVTGISWIHHLNRRFEDTAMGKTGHLGPSPEEPDEGNLARVLPVSGTQRHLTGEDLYRLNCRECHGESGQGTPPEINSVINPVRATSTPLILQRMKSTGMEISQAAATQMSREATAALMKRLHEGGENMPSFSYLTEAEIAAIFSYLKQIANIPNSDARQIVVNESPVRVGELVVKSTCHICHDATGANPTPQEILSGAIPPIEVLPRRVDETQFIRKVTEGSVIVMGDDALPYRGRMPVFYYLTEQEAADAFLYLHDDPPAPSKKAEFYLVASQGQSGGSGNASSGGAGGGTVTPPSQKQPSENEESLKVALLLIGLYASVTLMIAGGVFFTFREFRRLSPHVVATTPASRTQQSEAVGQLINARPVQ
jgi:mono/diheme cytochrome c family protein